jgi:uncharacterized protein YijF (DUF1287 family)
VVASVETRETKAASWCPIVQMPCLTKRNRWLILLACAAVAAGILGAQSRPQASTAPSRRDFLRQFNAAALERTHHVVRYDSAYIRIPYPGGDVPAGTGVCTDEVIRAYRAVGVDLQKEVHEDMAANFSAYPSKWRWHRQGPDSNIDHRRVPNLMVFFSRKGEALPITNRADDYGPGDLVAGRRGDAYWNRCGQENDVHAPVHD